MTSGARPGPSRPPVRLRPVPPFDPPYVDEADGRTGRRRPTANSPSTCSPPPGPARSGRRSGEQPCARCPAGPHHPPGRVVAAGDRTGSHPSRAPLRRHLPGGGQRLPLAGAGARAARPGPSGRPADRTRPRHRGRAGPTRRRSGRPLVRLLACGSASPGRPRWRRQPSSPARAAEAGRWPCAWNIAGAAGSASPCTCSDHHLPRSPAGSSRTRGPGLSDTGLSDADRVPAWSAGTRRSDAASVLLLLVSCRRWGRRGSACTSGPSHTGTARCGTGRCSPPPGSVPADGRRPTGLPGHAARMPAAAARTARSGPVPPERPEPGDPRRAPGPAARPAPRRPRPAPASPSMVGAEYCRPCRRGARLRPLARISTGLSSSGDLVGPLLRLRLGRPGPRGCRGSRPSPP